MRGESEPKAHQLGGATARHAAESAEELTVPAAKKQLPAWGSACCFGRHSRLGFDKMCCNIARCSGEGLSRAVSRFM
jgi:hypothetical protein